MEKITIRRAHADDVERIVRLSNAGGPEGTQVKSLPDQLPDGYYTAFQRIIKDPNQFLMAVEQDGKIIGTFHITYLTYLPGAGLEDCQIENVHVDAEYRNQGIGSLMLNWAIDQAKKRGCRRAQLTTNKHRIDAHRFYKKLGFELTHEGAKLNLNT